MSQVTPERILQLGFGFWASKLLLVAVQEGLFTELAKAPLDAPALAARLGWKARNAADAFDGLVSLGFLERGADGRYRNAPDAELFLDRAKPSYVGGILEMADARLYRFWGDLGEALRSNEPQNESKHFQGDHFEKLYGDPERLEGFLKAMTGISRGTAQALAQGFDWSGCAVVMDAGCAEGAVPVTLAQVHPHLRTVGFDLPPVGPIFTRFAQANGVADRVSFQGGSLFEQALPPADAIIMGHMLHWTDEAGKRLMVKRGYDALPAGGRLIVYDNLLDEERRSATFGFLMSLNMLVETPGGAEYTFSQAKAWFEEAGFRQVELKPLAGPAMAVVGTK